MAQIQEQGRHLEEAEPPGEPTAAGEAGRQRAGEHRAGWKRSLPPIGRTPQDTCTRWGQVHGEDPVLQVQVGDKAWEGREEWCGLEPGTVIEARCKSHLAFLFV